MFLTTLVNGVRKLAGRYQENSFQGLHSPNMLRRILERERARADRTGHHLSLLTFAPRCPEDANSTLVLLAKILRERLRATDELGWLDGRLIGVVLPNTAAHGAWKLADDVCLNLVHVPPPVCTVYSYPSDQLPHGANSDQPVSNQDRERGHPACSGSTNGRDSRAPSARRALKLEVFFFQPIPAWKRLLDVVGSAAALILLLPVFAVAAIAVKLSSPGPVIFRQRRSGLGGEPFVIYKFRTMVADAEARKVALLSLNEQDGPAFKMREDPRVTGVGRFLRRTSLDELPQLWNILKGDMSLVGPRPMFCDETDACERWHRRRLDVTPGLTCIWQIKRRSLVSFAEWVRMDLQYIRLRSLRQDLKLLLLTVPAVVSQKGAR